MGCVSQCKPCSMSKPTSSQFFDKRGLGLNIIQNGEILRVQIDQ